MKTPVKSTTIEMTDDELDKLLALASKPPLATDAHELLLAKITARQSDNPASNVVNFPISTKKAKSIHWLAALPLAASLAAGIWLGAAGQGTDYLFNVSDELASVADSFAASTGIDDAESLMEEDLT